MSTPNIATPCYPLLIDALRLLPGVGPRQERERLGEAKYRASRSPSLTAEFNGVQLTLTLLQELFVYDQQGRPRVSSAGATVLLDLYDKGAFTSFDDRKGDGDLEVLAQYSKGLATVVEFNYWRGAPRKARSRSDNVAPQKRIGQGLATTLPRAASQITDVPSVLFKALIHRLD